MGMNIVLKNADFSSHSIGKSEIITLDTTPVVFGKSVNPAWMTDPTADQYVAKADVTTAYRDDYVCTGEISIPTLDRNRRLWGILPILMTDAKYAALQLDPTTDAAQISNWRYNYFHRTSTNAWANAGHTYELYEEYAHKSGLYSGWTIVLGKWKLNSVLSDVDKMIFQWPANVGEASGVGIERPILYID